MVQYDLRAFNAVIRSEKTVNYLQDVLANKKENFVNNITALVTNNTSLQQCEPYSVLYAAIKATALNLPLGSNLGFAYVIPYSDKNKGQVAQFQIGYKGFIQLAIRTGQYSRINVTDIRDDELIDYNILTGDFMFGSSAGRENKPIIGYAAYFRLINGFEKSVFWNRDKIESHGKKYSKTFNSSNSLWKTNIEAMSYKTVLKNLLSKWGILSVDMQDALRYDQALITQDGYDYIDREQTAEPPRCNNPKINAILANALGVQQDGGKIKKNETTNYDGLLQQDFGCLTVEEQDIATEILDKDFFSQQKENAIIN